MVGGVPIVLILYYFLGHLDYDYSYYLAATLYSSLFYLFYFLTLLSFPRIANFSLSHNLPKSFLTAVEVTLITVGLGSLLVFFLANGFLFLKNNDYDDLFSTNISMSWMRNFFYFFFPGLIMWFLRRPSKNRLLKFLLMSLIYGAVVFFVVGGSRASIALAVAYSIILGIQFKYVKPKILFWVTPFLFLTMSWLAIIRYSYQPEGIQLAINMFSLLKGTLSPLDNVAAIIEWHILNEDKMQNLMPIVRDFYRYIPKWMWLEKTDIIMNSGNYLTFEVLKKNEGLTFSPTIVGSSVIMFGFPGLLIFSCSIAFMIKILDVIYDSSVKSIIPSTGLTHPLKIIFGTYCISIMFYFISMIRDGIDTFFSRMVFFSFNYLLILIASIFFSFLFENLSPRNYPKSLGD